MFDTKHVLKSVVRQGSVKCWPIRIYIPPKRQPMVGWSHLHMQEMALIEPLRTSCSNVPFRSWLFAIDWPGYIHTDIQTYIQAGRQADGQTGRQADAYMHTCRHADIHPIPQENLNIWDEYHKGKPWNWGPTTWPYRPFGQVTWRLGGLGD